ncbi:MAG: ABC transporter ATP-binding protein [Rhodospirillales bacterium]|nr:ABC transporter ATP-binding protein [Rhodospirillales bacterium]
MSLLMIRDLTVTAPTGQRGDADRVRVLRGISLSLDRGMVLGVVGESGAGKSLLGRVIAGQLPPGFAMAAGRVDFSRRNILALTPGARRAMLGREIAFIPQDPRAALNPVRTIFSQLREHFAHLGLPRHQHRARAIEVLADVQLPDPADLLGRFPHQLSAGMCQRVLIAMAFASRPLLLVADEPAAALDAAAQRQTLELIAAQRRRAGTAVLFITHDLRRVAGFCDRLAVLYAGAVVEEGAAAAVMSRPLHPYTRALELATPSLATRRGLVVLPGHQPGLAALGRASGCRFAPRCPVRSAGCAEREIPLIGDDRRVACQYPERTSRIAPAPPPPPYRVGSGEVLLQVDGLGRRLRAGGVLRGRVTAVLEDVSFKLREGEFLGIVGESGSGKSTLARLIVGLDRPTTGRIALAGADVTKGDGAARRIRLANLQMVFPDPDSALNPRRRIGSIVAQALEAARRPAVEREAVAADLMRAMGLDPALVARLPGQLSRGQRQRVSIARALAARPRLLVADDVVSGLDVSTQAQLLALLARLRASGIALVFISHDLAVVRHLCDRVIVMQQGRIVEAGETERVFTDPQAEHTRALLAAAPPDIGPPATTLLAIPPPAG